ncbi:MAG: AAA family ATPase [Mycoplasmataceae bacterium]|nr:AAA family ATPase [Mycoplasmataceae bacterium]
MHLQFKRKIYDEISEWKRNQKHVLLVEGARQIGKSEIIERFGRENYKNLIILNFIKHPELQEIFEFNLDPIRILDDIGLLFQVKIDRDTLLFFDEIQECGKAVASLKFLDIEKKCDIIASGSLMGIRKKESISWPVGHIEHLKMYPMDFEEFLWANGIDTSDLKKSLTNSFNSKSQISSVVNDKYLEIFKKYMTIGGMPEVVAIFLEENDYGKTFKKQNDIVEDYYQDIAKYAPASMKDKIRDCFASIPHQLMKENSKFQYKFVNKNAKSREYIASLNWLKDSNIIHYSYKIKKIDSPLSSYIDNGFFKVYLNDIGLLCSMIKGHAQMKLINDLLGENKGGIYENAIANIIVFNNKELFYYKPNENSSEDVDFVFESENNIKLIEVKSSNSKALTLQKSVTEKSIAIKTNNGNIGFINNIFTMPWYIFSLFFQEINNL